MENNNIIINPEEISVFPANTPLAMCYVPMQRFGEVFSENEALENGTIFPDLYFPFTGKEVTANGGE